MDDYDDDDKYYRTNQHFQLTRLLSFIPKFKRYQC